jgi:tetratricopeptide (TPR) repeat protein
MKTTLYFIVAATIGLSCAWAQKGGGSTGGAPAGGGAAGGTTAPSTPSGPSTNPGTGGRSGGGRGTVLGPSTTQQNPTQIAPAPRPIFISGTVSTDDGAPLPGSMNIQSVCGAEQRIVTHTSSKGDFSFQWGQNFGIFEDASQNGASSIFGGGNPAVGGMGGLPNMNGGMSNPLANCELRVDQAGYLSSHAPLFNYGQMDRIDVGTLVIHRLTGEEGTTISMLSMKAPKGAKKDFQKGTDQFRQRKFKDAETSFRKAVTAYPNYADAWLSLGRTQRQLGAHDAAREDFQKAMDLDKKLLGPWQELGYLASDQSKWEDAAKYLDQANRLDPMNSSMSWFFSAVADFNLGRFEAAERSIRSEIRLDQDKNPRAKYLLGLILLAQNDLTGGADALRSFLKVAPAGPDAEMAKKQLLRAEGMASK